MNPLSIASLLGLLLAYGAGTKAGMASAAMLLVAAAIMAGALLYLGVTEYTDGKRDGGNME